MKSSLLALSLFATFFAVPSARAQQELPVFQLSSGSHVGFGEYATNGDDYESLSALKKRCARKVETQALPCYEGSSGSVYEVAKLSNNLEQEFTRVILRNYGAKILQSEVQLSCNQSLYPISCPSAMLGNFPADSANTLKAAQQKALDLPGHEDLRQNAMSLQNAVGAAILAMRADATPNLPSAKAYKDRLKLYYPYLFKPMDDGYKELLELVNSEIMTIEVPSLTDGDVMLHAQTMQQLMAALDSSPDAKQRLEGKVTNLLNRYGQSVKAELSPAKKICEMEPSQIVSKYPQIVNQLILDLTPRQRELIGDALCASKEYYDPANYDTDCDGFADASDQSPNNPFAPTNSFKLTKFNTENPPFTTDANYSLKKDGNKIVVNLPLKLNIDASMADAEKATFNQQLNSCLNQDLKPELASAFSSFASERASTFPEGTEIDFQFQTTNPPADAKTLSVSKCWCSTCKLNYVYNGVTKEAPRSLCQADIVAGKVPRGSTLAAAEMNAIKKAFEDEVRKGNNPWWAQEDAGHLTGKTDCATIKHEVMHKLGLPDEYLADYYPFARIGTTNSIMNDPYASVLPRHLARILSPSAGQNYCTL